MFSWDVGKAQVNYQKHGVAFEEAATVFADPDGLERGERLMAQETIRIISARQASRKERKAYAG
jgi:uncharacterized DUF497 family protein